MGNYSLLSATFPLRTLFYAVTPNETSFTLVEDVPNIFIPAYPYFVLMLVAELVIATVKGYDVYAVGDILSSATSGLVSRLPEVFEKSIEMAVYIWFYNRYCIYSLPIDSIWTWLFTVLAVDFFYYWFHRASHEINILWAFHQTHHSSEYMNLSTALRKSFIQKYGSILFNLPMALFIPPSVAYIHIQLNLLFQFWIHTDLVDKLGPLEYVLNTPSHHRVHHGRNPYAVDKNYAGFLIIWDRLFGTFEPERSDEKLAYGLIHNINSFDAVYTQVNHFYEIWKKLRVVRKKRVGFIEKAVLFFKALFYGPGWFPSKPNLRMGDPKDLPPVEKEVKRYDKPMPLWMSAYCVVHFLLVVAIFVSSVRSVKNVEVGFIAFQPRLLAIGSLIFASLCSLSFIYDGKAFGSGVDAVRCALVAAVTPRLGQAFNVPEKLIYGLLLFFVMSFVVSLINQFFSNKRAAISLNPSPTVSSDKKLK